ncbi:LCP family protein [Neobacillus cucumis]|uniref:LCP family protein n=1 Tax=Neobacillus cucumis TaxID=1740721 RepID=UPI001962A180|nr:LCP family protein [Neobacillus cucumis]MBM7652504.1 LCP family protein required for cell wall assembly [Neobacillus cucumis]
MEKREKKGKRKWKILGLSILGIFVLGIAALGYEYYQLQPKNHFSTVPVVGAKKTSTDQVKTPIFNVLLIGSDQRKGQKLGHTDSMMLIHVDLNKNKYQAVSIPRDTRVHVDGYGYTKLTSVQYIMQAKKGTQKGVEAAVAAVSDFMGVPINYYVETNYWGFQSMVDSLGGINMNVPFDVTLTHPWYKENKNKVISAGTYSFDGKMVTEVVHERYSLKNGEYGRQQSQEEALKGIAKAALSPSKITKLPDLVKTIPQFVLATNMTTSDMLSLGLSAKDFDPQTQLTYQQIRGESKTLYDDILKAKNYQIVINQDQVKKIAVNFQ